MASRIIERSKPSIILSNTWVNQTWMRTISEFSIYKIIIFLLTKSLFIEFQVTCSQKSMYKSYAWVLGPETVKQLQSGASPNSLPPSEWLSHLWLIHWTPNIWGISGWSKSSFPFTTAHDSLVSANSQASPHAIFLSGFIQGNQTFVELHAHWSVSEMCEERLLMPLAHICFLPGLYLLTPFCLLLNLLFPFTKASSPMKPSTAVGDQTVIFTHSPNHWATHLDKLWYSRRFCLLIISFELSLFLRPDCTFERREESHSPLSLIVSSTEKALLERRLPL